MVLNLSATWPYCIVKVVVPRKNSPAWQIPQAPEVLELTGNCVLSLHSQQPLPLGRKVGQAPTSSTAFPGNIKVGGNACYDLSLLPDPDAGDQFFSSHKYLLQTAVNL